MSLNLSPPCLRQGLKPGVPHLQPIWPASLMDASVSRAGLWVHISAPGLFLGIKLRPSCLHTKFSTTCPIFLVSITFIYCVGVVTCAKMHVWKSEGTLRELAFSFYQIQVTRAGSRTLPAPNHITTPSLTSKPTVSRILFLSSLFPNVLILYLVVRHKILLESVYTIMAVVHFFSLKTILFAWHSVS